jgi:hypothetical protein
VANDLAVIASYLGTTAARLRGPMKQKKVASARRS